jgi:regulator of replication initiation timing
MLNDDNSDLAQQAMSLQTQVQSLKIGNTILQAEINRLQDQLTVAEQEAKKRKAKAMVPALAIIAATIQQIVVLIIH